MKHKKQLIAALTAGTIAAGMMSAMPLSASAADKTLLVLGDSIAAGYGLPENDYGYYDYIGKMTGSTVKNLAVSGATTTDLLALIATEDGKKAIAAADTICISIGGNDLLGPTLQELQRRSGVKDNDIMAMFKVLSKKGSNELLDIFGSLYDELGEAKDQAVTNISSIISQISAANSKAKVVIQTIYNPLEYYTTSYQGTDYSADYKSLQNFASSWLNKINDPMKKLENENVKVADIRSLYQDSGWLYVNVENKDVHPTPLGHAMIASAILDKLEAKDAKTDQINVVLSNLKPETFASIPQDDYQLLTKYCTAVMGDVDGSGRIDSIDATKVLVDYSRSLIGEKALMNANELVRASVYGDGKLNEKDAVAILRYYGLTLLGGDASWKDVIL